MSGKKALAWNLLVPFFMLLVSEGVTGNLLRLFAPGVILGTAIYYILYLGVFFFAGTTKASWLLLNLAVYGLAAGEYFVISFRERPAMIWDVLALRTAMTVSANYRFTVTPGWSLHSWEPFFWELVPGRFRCAWKTGRYDGRRGEPGQE